MDLWIANATRQNVEFCYVLPEAKTLRRQHIAPGAQVRISGDPTSDQVDDIVKQHAKYGMVDASEMDTSRGFRGLCYSIGRPVPGAKIVRLADANLDELVKLGRQIREDCAVAQNNHFETALVENGRPERVKAFEVTIQQEQEDPRNDVPQMSEGLRVTRQGSDGGYRGRRSGKRRAA